MTTSYDGRPDFIPIRSIQWDSSWPRLVGKDERYDLLSYIQNRFGIPENIFDGYLLFNRKKNWWLLKDSTLIAQASQLKVCMVGLRAFQKVGRFIKPTTRLIQLFGHCATKARLEVNLQQLQSLLKGEHLKVDLELDNGYVILTLMNRPLGLGLLIDGVIRSQIPRKELRFLPEKGIMSSG